MIATYDNSNDGTATQVDAYGETVGAYGECTIKYLEAAQPDGFFTEPLERFRDAVFGWCYDRQWGWSFLLLYYHVVVLPRRLIDFNVGLCKKPMLFWSGFV